MRDQARVVVVGGGIYGVSIAYHLAKMGWTDLVLLEKNEIASGESAHAAGLVTQFATSETLMKIRKYSIDLFSELGLFEHVGSLRVASSPEQLRELQRSVSRARGIGMEVEIISAEEACRLMPQMSAQDLYGAIYLPRDGHLDPYTTTTGMARLLKEMGVAVYTHTPLTGIELSPRGEICRVRTPQGSIRAEIVVDAAGLWGPRVAAMAGIFLPTTPIDHQHVALKAIRGCEFPHDTPCLRDPDNLVYLREEAGGLVIGGYEPDPFARWIDGVPWQHAGEALPPDFERFSQLMEGAIRRIPFLDRAEIIRLTCHPGAYSPDCKPMLGPVPGARGLWIAAGMSLNGFGGAGGIGRLMAEWIVEGEPSMDIYEFRATRFGNYYADLTFTSERTRECVKYYYRLRFPNDEYEWARPHRVSALHSRLMELGAAFGEKFGWERVNYFEPGKPWRRMGEDQRRWGWSRPPYFERLRQEHNATRQRACLFDLSSFGKIEVRGPGALGLLQRLADNDLDRPPGSAVYTQFLNARGGVEADVTITRLAEERFRLITGSSFVANDLAWLQMHLRPEDAPVEMRDVTLEWSCLALWGPQARRILQKVTDCDLSNRAFPYLHAAEIEVGPARVLAQRVSYAGELGWELYVAPERAIQLWDALRRAGEEFELQVGGYKVLDSLRLEKGYRYFSVDLTPMEDPYAAGLGFCVRLEKGDFLGREALLRIKDEGVRHRLCTLVLEGEEYLPIYGGEAVYQDGRVVARLRSAGYGFTVERNLAYAYLPAELAAVGTPLEVEVFDRRFPAAVAPSVLVDPKGEKLKS